MRSRRVELAILFALLLSATAVQADHCEPARAWQAKLRVPWDANQNRLEEAVEALPAKTRVDLLLDLNRCPTPEDLKRFKRFGSVAYVGKYLSVVLLKGVRAGDAALLARDPQVVMVEMDHKVSASLNTSVRAIRVRSSFDYSPDTVQDRHPGITGAGISTAILDSGVDDGVH